ncbi:MAG: response regulator [Chloroflexaceae bacterium]|jgi:CheY-like chemotaxis protein|nr:response regulator [Chloroflexaceae bacterium]
MSAILVIDDEPVILEVLEEALTSEGHEVFTARHGGEGLAHLARQPVDLVLCDLMMPVMDGGTFCQTLHSAPHFQAIPIVLMSAAPDSGIGDNCSHVAFIRKPFDINNVLDTIARLLDPPLQVAA